MKYSVAMVANVAYNFWENSWDTCEKLFDNVNDALEFYLNVVENEQEIDTTSIDLTIEEAFPPGVFSEEEYIDMVDSGACSIRTVLRVDGYDALENIKYYNFMSKVLERATAIFWECWEDCFEELEQLIDKRMIVVK